MGASVFGYFSQRRAVADTWINGRIWCTWYQLRTDVSGFFHRQRVETELDPTRIPHRSS
jgi:hypothetical protein